MKAERFTSWKYDYGPDPWAIWRGQTHGQFYWNWILTADQEILSIFKYLILEINILPEMFALL